MFPSRYYAPRYFAARYWPKVGAAPPPPSASGKTYTPLRGLAAARDPLRGLAAARDPLKGKH